MRAGRVKGCASESGFRTDEAVGISNMGSIRKVRIRPPEDRHKSWKNTTQMVPATSTPEASPLCHPTSVSVTPCQTVVSLFAGTWWVLHTRARNEKAVADTLERQGIAHFLPLVTHQRRYAGRIRQVEIPLFPGYVFLCGGISERHFALRTNRVAQVLEVPNQERLRADLQQIERVIASHEPVDLFPRIVEGARCRVVSGSLRGLEGVVLRRRGPWRVYVGVDFLGQSAELEIESALIEVLDDVD